MSDLLQGEQAFMRCAYSLPPSYSTYSEIKNKKKYSEFLSYAMAKSRTNAASTIAMASLTSLLGVLTFMFWSLI